MMQVAKFNSLMNMLTANWIFPLFIQPHFPVVFQSVK